MKLVYPAYFEKLSEGGYLISFPDLLGCMTQGDDLADAIEMAIDAASGWLLDELEDGNKVPPPSDIKSFSLKNPDDIVNLVVLDMDTYAEKYGNKAIRKNCTIPAWLNTLAEKKLINFSAVLQEALYQKLDIS